MLRASLLTTFILCAGCGSGFDPAERRDANTKLKKSRPKIILAYEVKRRSGETMRSVSQRFHIPLNILERFNPRAVPERRPAILYVPVTPGLALRASATGEKLGSGEKPGSGSPIVKLMRDPFLRPINIGVWSALEEDQFQTLDEWFLPDEEQRLSFPVEGYISSGFSWRWNRFHKGLDIAARAGSPIVAAQDGRVIFRGWRSGFGLLVIIQHKQGRTYYAHCQSTKVKEGQIVSRGDLIATVGATGQSRGPHLHFEFRDNHNRPLDPTAFLMPPCSRPVALSAQPGPSLAGMTGWPAKSSPCQSSDL